MFTSKPETVSAKRSHSHALPTNFKTRKGLVISRFNIVVSSLSSSKLASIGFLYYVTCELDFGLATLGLIWVFMLSIHLAVLILCCCSLFVKYSQK